MVGTINGDALNQAIHSLGEALDEQKVLQNGTKELIGIVLQMEEVTDEYFTHDALHTAEMVLNECICIHAIGNTDDKFMGEGQKQAAINELRSKVIDGYYIHAYSEVVSKFMYGMEELTDKDISEVWTTRQFSVMFEQLHCFQSIQFLVRDNGVHIMVNMRSCDFDNKFKPDMALAYLLGRTLKATLVRKHYITSDGEISMTISIGSLHKYVK